MVISGFFYCHLIPRVTTLAKLKRVEDGMRGLMCFWGRVTFHPLLLFYVNLLFHLNVEEYLQKSLVIFLFFYTFAAQKVSKYGKYKIFRAYDERYYGNTALYNNVYPLSAG